MTEEESRIELLRFAVVALVKALRDMLWMAGIRSDEVMWDEEAYQSAKRVYEDWKFYLDPPLTKQE